ncbi:3-alpha,7-alpha,12-alpha-trihydroxy-5-beta-cholest-24-enoyl-CoA hydratase [Allopusillimonas soli]|uniref:MaoC family dehydratase N-terminal domain-containing protein n=1 Tax=Allopusillimonas soli TaxID=659016 RepID=A0A853F4S5_9BURK|nr:MaoC/PaaZ C-terminal domain-containing protein [Allopusillimonas soli]NYT35485.1 MaoC family dehydratase N-terminal domain-containing protein [Allopusillimonas soli]TEA75897.1 3-alpha,7-alpha,12-alpha-trihydroxy-5-beta-cholest-24-enoyl-CoA hydratase [Allopusillimonas soli]
MPLDYKLIKNWKFDEVRHAYTGKDVILYALGIGLGQDPLDKGQLQYVYEDGLKVFPSMAAVLGYPGFWMKNPETGITWVKLVHGEQRMHFHAPFPAQGEVIGRSRITHVIDKGSDKGALVVTERKIHDAATDALLATVEQVTFCRADGGFGNGDESPQALPKVPATPPDAVCELATLPQAALIYRLSGDDNPLHADPAVASKAGYPRPILHGLCTYGVAAHAIVRTLCGNDGGRLAYMHTRFSAPVFPGETLSVEMWKGDGGTVQFQAKVVERGVVVLSNGIAGVNQ